MIPVADTFRFFLISYPFVFLVGSVLLVWANKQLKRPTGLKALLLWFLFGLSVYGPLLLTNLPMPDNPAAYCELAPKRDMVLIRAFAFLGDIEDAKRLFEAGKPWWRWPIQQVILNSVMLMPFGFLLNLIWKAGFLRGFVLGGLFSVFLELTQLTGLWGWFGCAYRTFDTDDVILNASGAGLAAGSLWGLRILITGFFSLFRKHAPGKTEG